MQRNMTRKEKIMSVKQRWDDLKWRKGLMWDSCTKLLQHHSGAADDDEDDSSLSEPSGLHHR